MVLSDHKLLVLGAYGFTQNFGQGWVGGGGGGETIVVYMYFGTFMSMFVKVRFCGMYILCVYALYENLEFIL